MTMTHYILTDGAVVDKWDTQPTAQDLQELYIDEARYGVVVISGEESVRVLKSSFPIAVMPIAIDNLPLLPATGDDDDRFITAMARHPDMHCLRFSMYVEAALADDDAANALHRSIK